MYSFSILFIYILLFNLKSINSIEEPIKIWENTTNYKRISLIPNDAEIFYYSSDDETGAELYSFKSQEKYYFYFENDSKKIKEEYGELIDIQSPLFKFNSIYYFCTSLKLMVFDGNTIKDVNINDLNNSNFTLKCLRGSNNSIVLVFLNTNKISFIYPHDGNLNYTYETNLGNYIAINNYFEKKGERVFWLTALIKKEDSNYYLVNIKKENHDKASTPSYEQPAFISSEKMKLFSSIELSTYFTATEEIFSFIFTYEKNSENFHVYRVDKKREKFFEFRFFNVFKNFNITFAKYFNDSCILYYSITSSVPDNNQNYKSYIGVIDIEYNLGLFNMESDYKGKIYFNYGSKDKRDIKLIYFINDLKVFTCPFVNQNNACLNEFENNRYIVSKNNNGFYFNNFLEKCPDGFKNLGNYCFENCTDGFYIDGKDKNNCTFCEVDGLNKIFFIISKECDHPKVCQDKKYVNDSSRCYDCDRAKKIFYDYDCIDNCSEILRVPNGTNLSDCIKCEDKYHDNKYYFSKNEKNCTLCENGVKDDNKNLCSECKYNDDGNNSYFKILDKCIDDCNKYYSVDNDSICTFCENNYYYEKGECKPNSCQLPGYGMEKVTLNFTNENKTLNVCILCKDNTINKSNIYFQNKKCINKCEGDYKKIAKDNICMNCIDSKSYFFIDTQDCIDKCPDYTKSDSNAKTCEFCQENLYFYDNQCFQQCRDNQTSHSDIYNDKYKYNYCIDPDCGKNEKYINGSCFCPDQFYSPTNLSCYKCLCWSDKDSNLNYTCNEANGQCYCLDKYYGDSCEFYLVEGNETMTITTINNRLIKSSKNYFTYILSDHITLSDEYNFMWEVFFNDRKISDEEKYKKYFTTASNEKIFGINKEIFDEKGDNTIYISLNIIKNEAIIYHSKIRLNIIELIEDISKFEPKYNDIIFNEMNTHLKIKLVDENEKYQGRYEFQYGLVDENNERLPLTDYIESNHVDLNLICPISFDVNIRNDRQEEKNYRIEKVSSCNPSNFSIDNIINGTYFRSEKIFLLKSYLKSKKKPESYELENIINFINDIINEAINKDGRYIEPKLNISLIEAYTRNLFELENNPTNLNITYFEPKNIFSLMNYFLTYRKKYLNQEYVLSIFNSFGLLFEKIFTEDNISNKTLSDNDIKSLFRTIDNLYDIIIDRNINSTKENLFYDNFIEVLENISRYLSYKAYPSETIRLRGKRISLFIYNLGEHQLNKNISFLYFNKKDNFYINNFPNYSFENYDMSQKLCSQKDTAFFCLTEGNYSNFIRDLELSYEDLNLNNLTLSIFLMEEIKKNTIDKQLTVDGPDGEQEFQRVILKNNNTAIFRLINKKENFVHIINNNNISLEFDLEFPFFINNQDNTIVEEESNNYLTRVGYDIPSIPDYRNYACIPKSYYDNNTYYCFTHFDFKKNSTRCQCRAKLNDAIILVENNVIAEQMKDKQFQKSQFELNNKYGLMFIYIFILLLLIPTIYYLLSDIIKDSKDLKKNNVIDFEVDRKTTYNEIKKYCNTSIFVFSLYLTLRKFPYFSPFNKYNKRYPRFIKHLIIIMGLLIGFLLSLFPFIFVSFIERDIFKNQRSLDYFDPEIKLIVPGKYYLIGIFFSIFGYIFTNLFIYTFSKILNFEQEEIDIWLDIKTMCKDYIYYEIKSEVLLGPIWNKIKSRMMAYYYICGGYYLKRGQKNKFSNYLDQISRIQVGRKTVMPEFSEMDQILPRTTDSSEFASVLDINNSKSNEKKKNKSVEMTSKDNNEPLLDKEGNEDKEQIITKFNFNNNKIIDNDDTPGLKMRRTDNFSLDNTFISDEKTKRQIEHFTKVRNKYIYINKRKDVNEIEIDDRSNDGDENVTFNISPQFNYAYFSSDSLNSQGNNMTSKGESKDIYNFVFISIILLAIFVLLLIFIIWFIRKILAIFDEFIINAWIIPIVINLTIVSFLLYYIKIFIGSLLLFHFYHWRKKGRFFRILYLIFADQSMIYAYKVRNLITKYKKEFDYL